MALGGLGLDQLHHRRRPTVFLVPGGDDSLFDAVGRRGARPWRADARRPRIDQPRPAQRRPLSRLVMVDCLDASILASTPRVDDDGSTMTSASSSRSPPSSPFERDDRADDPVGPRRRRRPPLRLHAHLAEGLDEEHAAAWQRGGPGPIKVLYDLDSIHPGWLDGRRDPFRRRGDTPVSAGPAPGSRTARRAGAALRLGRLPGGGPDRGRRASQAGRGRGGHRAARWAASARSFVWRCSWPYSVACQADAGRAKPTC